MSWFEIKGKENDIVLSSRVRLARNVEGFAFGVRLSQQKATELCDRVSAALTPVGFSKTDLANVTPLAAEAMVEQHLISREFAVSKTPRVLLRDENRSLFVMVGEEDHIRVQCILPGLSLEDAFRFAADCDDTLDAALPLAFDEKLGYLTHCPTNLGTGMRASVMLFLPALAKGGYIASLAAQLSKIGLTLRGLYGEGSAPHGCLYQLSNQVTLGVSEQEILAKLEQTVATVIKKERELREALSDEEKERRRDRILRAVGTMHWATLVSSEEFFSLFVDVKLGISLGIVKDITHEALNSLLIRAMPATLSMAQKEAATGSMARDKARADLIKQAWEVKKDE